MWVWMHVPVHVYMKERERKKSRSNRNSRRLNSNEMSCEWFYEKGCYHSRSFALPVAFLVTFFTVHINCKSKQCQWIEIIWNVKMEFETKAKSFISNVAHSPWRARTHAWFDWCVISLWNSIFSFFHLESPIYTQIILHLTHTFHISCFHIYRDWFAHQIKVQAK